MMDGDERTTRLGRGLVHSAASVAGLLIALSCLVGGDGQGTSAHAEAFDTSHGTPPAEEGCLTCHQGIEEMHPALELSCTDCHGGDPLATSKEAAHVSAPRSLPTDERLWGEDFSPAYVRFINPTDLRVAEAVCGECHEETVDDVHKSMHATTAGHLSDGLYENGLAKRREDRWSIFAVEDDDNFMGEHAYERLPGFLRGSDASRRDELAGHVADLERKNCMQCHLWGEGTAVRGRLGLDGNYRASGCAACHVTYADDGLSHSADPTIDKFEPGHPISHTMTTAPPTDTCTRCHFGDASIGLHFRGLAQLFPGMPAGPEVPGTTDSRLNEAYYINDSSKVPADVHHRKGMHCIDCHTTKDVMGDGDIYGFMEHAVEIECVDCHGTFSETSTLKTSRGRPLEHLHEEDGSVYMISKVDGVKHWVPQAAHVIDPARPEYNPRASRAMTEKHAKLECYTCHAGWNVNFFGFHFDRNESFTDLDFLSGQRSAGRCTTQEKVFATLEHFYIGYNDEGMIAPYLVGFSTMGTVHDEEGGKFIDQQLPVTADGLSGMTMIHHQLHSTQSQARDCVECHRAPSTLGLGSGNFRLSRDFAAVTDDLGLHLVALDRTNLELSESVARLPLPKAGRIAAVCDELQGHFQTLYITLDGGGVAVVDVSNPAFPQRLTLIPTVDPKAVVVRSNVLYVADGRGGLRLFDVSKPTKPKELASVPTADARALDLSWPFVYVADGPGGVKVFDVSDAKHPDFVAHLDTNGSATRPDDATAVRVLFQYSHPDDGRGKRSAARRLAVVAAGADGPQVWDTTHFDAPRSLSAPSVRRRGQAARDRAVDVEVISRYDLGSQGGEIPTEENDYAYFTVRRGDDDGDGRTVVLRLTNPRAVEVVDRLDVDGGTSGLELAAFYNPPFLQRFVMVTGGAGVTVFNVSNSEQPEQVGLLFGGGRNARGLALEEFSFDRMVNEAGESLKDISHPTSRYLDRDEVLRVLRAPLDSAANSEER